MEYTQIPGTELQVSRLALGTWAIGGWMWGGTDEDLAIKTIHAAIDKGVNLIDTAPVYGFGRSEQIVGKALALKQCRGRVCISTKTGLDWRDGQVFRNCSPDFIRRSTWRNPLTISSSGPSRPTSCRSAGRIEWP